MTRKPHQGLIAGFIDELTSHLLEFVLFIAIPAGAGLLVGVFAPISVIFGAVLGAVVGFIAWCLWNWQTILTGFHD